MKQKYFLAIVSCSVVALSTSIPSTAETVKEGYIQSESTSIQNKDYRNKQSTPSIVGSWKSGVEDNEYRYTDPMEWYVDIRSDGTYTSAHHRENGDSFHNATYQYGTKDGVGVWVEKDTGFVSAIKWISENEFIEIVVESESSPQSKGARRRFVRIQEPVATQLQQQAQARTQRPTTNDYTDYNHTVNFGRQLPSALDSIKFNL